MFPYISGEFKFFYKTVSYDYLVWVSSFGNLAFLIKE